MDYLDLAQRFGLPLAAFVLFAVSMYKGWLRAGPEVDKALDVAKGEIAYRESLRVEERERTVRLETTLATQTTSLRDITEVLKDVERELRATSQ